MNHGRPAGPAPDPDNCPPDPQETAEAYLLHHLRPDEAEAFEDHYIACARCAAVVEETGRFVAAMKQAAQGLCKVSDTPRARGAAAAPAGGSRGN